MSDSKVAAPVYSVSPSQAIRLIEHFTSRVNSRGDEKPMLAPFIWGAPGIGKTEIVRTVAKTRNSRIVALHLPQFDPTDIKGIPVKMDDGTIRWMPSSYFPQQFAKFVDNHNPNETVEIDVTWDYAEDVAVYIVDRYEKEIGRFGDPCLPNIGDAEITVVRDGVHWRVTVDNLPADAFRVVLVDKAIIFLDELSSADPSTQNAALQLVLDRRVGEYDVPLSVPVLAAGNREEDGAFVQTLSHPLCNRFAHLTMTVDVDDWIDWAILSGVRPEIIGMIKWNAKALFSYDPASMTNGQYGFATPRTWTFLSDQYEDIEFFKNMVDMRKTGGLAAAEKMRLTMFSGIIGQAWASAFIGYLQVMHDLPSPAEIIAGTKTEIGKVERSQSFGLLYALIYTLQHRYDKYYDPAVKPQDQADEWTVARDRIFDFITNNFDSESAAWASTVLIHTLNISVPALRSEAFLKFSDRNVGVISRVSRRRAS